MDNTTVTLLVISNISTVFLFMLSEYLSMSSCSANGVLQFILGGCCMGGGNVDVNNELYYNA